ncbi:hypothetical protein U0030_12005 [Brevundimonas bullata]|uniref:hypothetical protein n=1 Tax=Brevundimonas bullata TaxID=13160 RepID=UPI000E0B5CF8|nr:hypothetical protein [Brevundimonas bullata]WQE35991.1 hypothetical protein U0030_12005 [Brevundimonas bullata]
MGSEIIFIIPAALGFAAIATLGGTLVVWLVWMLARRWGPLSRRGGSSHFPIGATAAVLLAISLPAGCIRACQPIPQPESLRTVAAFEVPLTSAVDRANFLTILTAEARAEGLDLNVETAKEMERWAEMLPELRRSIHATVYRGGDLRQTEAYVSDRSHLGHAWISFTKGEDPALARRFRERLMSRTVERWPETLSVPVAQTGSLPNKEDLVLGDHGYEIGPAEMAGYLCGTAPGNSPHSACD